MIPRTLDEWSVDVITELLAKGYYETEIFDFKEMLPSSKNEDGKFRLYKTCCAFANSSGGFLVFGIKDQKSLATEDRMVGIDVAIDFPARFGTYPANCVPSIEWNFLNPPLTTEKGKFIQIVHIPRSWNAPHGFGNKDEGWQFPKRTNKGNEGMSYEEVRLLFLGYYEKRLKLQLLIAELENIKGIAEYVASTPPGGFSLHTFELDIIHSILSDTYTILAENRELIALLSRIRVNCRAANSIIGIHLDIAATQQQIQNLSSHMNDLKNGCAEIISESVKAISILQQITDESR